jgi:hypothetical protein
MDVSDSALLATLLREAPIGFAFFGTDLCFRRVNRSLARLYGRPGYGPSPLRRAPSLPSAACSPTTSPCSSPTSRSAC